MGKSDRVICLNGHVCCSGKPEAVAQHQEYERLFGPAKAKSFAVYTHHHDHAHDISGAPKPIADALPVEPKGR
jgi:zinc transport system ATP-binding protein